MTYVSLSVCYTAVTWKYEKDELLLSCLPNLSLSPFVPSFCFFLCTICILIYHLNLNSKDLFLPDSNLFCLSFEQSSRMHQTLIYLAMVNCIWIAYSYLSISFSLFPLVLKIFHWHHFYLLIFWMRTSRENADLMTAH
jgi:hypothetical protein